MADEDGDGYVRDVLSPERSLTKMWWLSSSENEGEEVVDEVEEEREVRILEEGCLSCEVM